MFSAEQYGNLVRVEVILAAVILIGVYILITFELVHRTVAAAMGAFFTLVCAYACRGGRGVCERIDRHR